VHFDVDSQNWSNIYDFNAGTIVSLRLSDVSGSLVGVGSGKHTGIAAAALAASR
jgi:hypothetical protein